MRRLSAFIGLMAVVATLAAVPGTATAEEERALPTGHTYRDGRDAHWRVDVLRVHVSTASKWEPDPQSVMIDKRTRFRRGDHVTLWFNLDRDRRPEGRLDHTIGRGARVRKVHGWGKRWPIFRTYRCIEQNFHPFLTNDGRSWGADLSVECFNHPRHGRLGRSWAVTARVSDDRRHDAAPGALSLDPAGPHPRPGLTLTPLRSPSAYA